MAYHLYLLFIILVFCAGMVYFVPALIVYQKRKELFKYYRNYRYFFSFFFSVTMLIFSYSIYSYSIKYIQDFGQVFFNIIIVAQILAVHGLLVYFPSFINSFFQVPFRVPVNRLFRIVALVSLTGTMTLFTVSSLKGVPSLKQNVEMSISYVFNGIFFFAVTYATVIAVLYMRRLNDQFLAGMARTYLVLSFLILPGIFLNLFIKWEMSVFHELASLSYFILPALYLAWTLVATYYSVRYYLFMPEEVPTGTGEGFDERYSLTRRESEILILITQGFSNAEIGDELSISLPTVKTHIGKILQKTGARNRAELLSIIIHEEK